MGTLEENDEAWERERARRRAERRRRRQREARIKRAIVLTAMGLFLFLVLVLGSITVKHMTKKAAAGATETAYLAMRTKIEASIPAGTSDGTDSAETVSSYAVSGDYTISGLNGASYLGSDEVTSTQALLVDADNRTVLYQRGAGDRISPASMTKVLTLLVAVEHVSNLDDTFTITREITDYSYSHDCSAVGFDENETVTVRDLLYGTILPSGGDAAAGLAYYVSGSLDGFAELMNQKLQELGISGSAHFTNCVGLYDDNHYCTLYDLAVIMTAAMDNPLCSEILNARTYTTSATEQHPDGIIISNWFLRRIEDKDTHGEIIGAKTGYVVQSGNCAVSVSRSNSGRRYICVTADAHSAWRCIYDHVAVYQNYTE
ncbi:D-alanyl-D-alanine carboxypeptidase family protein [Laedolimicola intestinihominis]|uniref:D-alanyl-D-alanine carboxypeptidase n=1 Tax=Laedolimicola intestinihominis TaxID=3133166 RepID=A0ABV1FJZ2_9FIRM